MAAAFHYMSAEPQDDCVYVTLQQCNNITQKGAQQSTEFIRQNGIHFHGYVDDNQLYLSNCVLFFLFTVATLWLKFSSGVMLSWGGWAASASDFMLSFNRCPCSCLVVNPVFLLDIAIGRAFTLTVYALF